MSKPHVHAALIKAWADGAEIEWYDPADSKWYDASAPTWCEHRKYRIKPERVFPKTTLTDAQLFHLWDCEAMLIKALKDVANAAIKQYIIDTEK